MEKKRSLQKTPVGKKADKRPSMATEVTINIMRKYNPRQYESLDVSLTVTAQPDSDEEGFLYETQEEVTARVFAQMKKDMVKMGNEVRKMVKDNEF
jgi:hypothetical protein